MSQIRGIIQNENRYKKITFLIVTTVNLQTQPCGSRKHG